MFLLDDGSQLHGFLEKWIFVQPVENHSYWKQHFFEQGIADPDYLKKYEVHNNHENLVGTTFHDGKNMGMDYSHFEADEIRPRCKALLQQLQYTNPVEKFGWWHQNYIKNGYHSPHNHNGSIISGIYLVELENENTTVFYSQKDDREYSFVLNSVREGDLILFDSTAWHSVDPSDGKKISICFNAS